MSHSPPNLLEITPDGYFPLQVSREYEEELLNLCATGSLDRTSWPSWSLTAEQAYPLIEEQRHFAAAPSRAKEPLVSLRRQLSHRGAFPGTSNSAPCSDPQTWNR
jgi:hypothetical protein